MKRLLAAVLAVALPALGQEPLPPPPEPALAEPTYFDRCFASPAQLYVDPVPRAVVEVGGSGPSPTGAAPVRASGGNGGGGSGGDGKAALLLAVVLAAVLPLVVYALDSDVEPLVVQRFRCPSVSFEASMGGETSTRTADIASIVSGRFTAAMGFVGGDFQFDLGPVSPSSVATHLLLRVLPKQHVEGALAVGYHRMGFGTVREGVEVGLPHRYALFRDGLRTVGLDVRPMVMFGAHGLDAGLEAAFVVPILEFLHARVGGRVYSFGADLFWGASGGLLLTL